MSRNTSPIGRMGVLNPEIHFDTEDGGTELYNHLTTMFTKFSNHIVSRWQNNINLTASGGGTDYYDLQHNFDVTLSTLKYIIVSDGTMLQKAQTTYSVTAPNNNTLRVTNLSGSAHVVELYVYAAKPKIELVDLDTEVTSKFPTLLAGGTSIGGTYVGDVFINGNTQLSSNSTIYGNLYVTGSISQDSTNKTLTVYGEIFCGDNIGYLTSVANVLTISCEKNIYCNNISAKIQALYGNLVCNDLTLCDASDYVIKGNLKASLVTRLKTQSVGNLLVEKSIYVKKYIDLCGTAAITYPSGQRYEIDATANKANATIHGSSLTCYGSIYVNEGGIYTVGGYVLASNTTDSCGNAGSVTCYGNIHCKEGLVLTGGSVGGSKNGNGGTLTVSGNVNCGITGLLGDAHILGGAISTCYGPIEQNYSSAITLANGGNINVSGNINILETSVMLVSGIDDYYINTGNTYGIGSALKVGNNGNVYASSISCFYYNISTGIKSLRSVTIFLGVASNASWVSTNAPKMGNLICKEIVASSIKVYCYTPRNYDATSTYRLISGTIEIGTCKYPITIDAQQQNPATSYGSLGTDAGTITIKDGLDVTINANGGAGTVTGGKGGIVTLGNTTGAIYTKGGNSNAGQVRGSGGQVSLYSCSPKSIDNRDGDTGTLITPSGARYKTYIELGGTGALGQCAYTDRGASSEHSMLTFMTDTCVNYVINWATFSASTKYADNKTAGSVISLPLPSNDLLLIHCIKSGGSTIAKYISSVL